MSSAAALAAWAPGPRFRIQHVSQPVRMATTPASLDPGPCGTANQYKCQNTRSRGCTPMAAAGPRQRFGSTWCATTRLQLTITGRGVCRLPR